MTDFMTFDVHKGADSLSIVFSSTMENIDRTDGIVKDFLASQGLENKSFAVRVALREGLTNSVRHGNKNKADKLIRFDLKITGGVLSIVIEDQGDGFDWKSVLNQCTKLKVQVKNLSDHGRGILIMNDYCDTYTYNEKGNKVILEKNISS